VSLRSRVDKRLLKKEKAFETEQLMKEKRSEELEALEEVFDRSTLMVIYDFLNAGVIGDIFGAVSAGKESRVYWAKSSDGRELAVKIFLTVSAEFRKGMLRYIEGDPRFKSIKHDTRSLIFTWARKEYRNLEQATWAKVRVPKPVAVKSNVLIMEFIGKDGKSAPSLKEQTPANPERVYGRILVLLQRLYVKAKLVHGDLSEYNIMIWKGHPVLFDVSQAVSVEHPMSDFLLLRDLTNLNRFFSRLGTDVLPVEVCYRKVTGHGKA
jgi:RIO kinase 1